MKWDSLKRTDLGMDTVPYGKFRSGYREIIDDHRDEPFAVGPYGRPEVVVLPSELYQRLAEAHRELQDVRRTVPLLVAAAQAGVAFPSESLAELGFQPVFHADKLAAFVSQFAGGPTHDEESRPLSESRVGLTHAPVEEDDLELTYRDHVAGD